VKEEGGFEEARPVDSAAEGDYPVIGDTTTGLGEYLVREGRLPDADAYKPIRRDALAIVRNSRRFSDPDGTRTGLVVGYVQSGKTLSMTSVSALARDNGCRIIIVLAGVTTNLLQQNANRFKKDLRAASGKTTAWRIFNSQDGLGDPDLQHLQQAVAEWRDRAFSELDQQTFLYLVLKNHAHLDKLYAHLSRVKLHGIPALIIDDEADQAGLNTAPGEEEASTTYQRIARVRSALPHHTYLQYTATPQAPLLIALDDMLSPAFAELVEPGAGYTGGQAFFGTGALPGIVRAIPESDQFKPGSPPEDPPDSLLEAMRAFFVGCAVAGLRKAPKQRSMLIHPSPRQADHHRYLTWVQEIIKRWAGALRSKDDEEKQETLDEFRPAYADLAKTDLDLPPFEDLAQRLLVSLGRVSLKEVNSQDGSEVDWENAEDHILVGGEKLNRGFTVEGLTVTYMPRDAGGWNADTIQQRARFFGYKAKYLSLCRLYLHPDVIHAYRAYVRHEEDIRGQLAAHRGRPLREWRRAFFLDAKMRPTRQNVLFDPYYRIRADRPWFIQSQPHIDAEAAARNAELVRRVLAPLTFHAAPGYFENTVCLVSLGEFFREVLLDAFAVRGTDVPSWYGHMVMLRDVLEGDPNAKVQLVLMDTPRERNAAADGSIKLHQGRSSSKKQDKYTGDAQMCDPTLVTIQIHRLTVPSVSVRPLPALAIHIPIALRKDDVVAQDAPS
jgi:hypothetical protein